MKLVFARANTRPLRIVYIKFSLGNEYTAGIILMSNFIEKYYKYLAVLYGIMSILSERSDKFFLSSLISVELHSLRRQYIRADGGGYPPQVHITADEKGRTLAGTGLHRLPTVYDTYSGRKYRLRNQSQLWPILPSYFTLLYIIVSFSMCIFQYQQAAFRLAAFCPAGLLKTISRVCRFYLFRIDVCIQPFFRPSPTAY